MSEARSTSKYKKSILTRSREEDEHPFDERGKGLPKTVVAIGVLGGALAVMPVLQGASPARIHAKVDSALATEKSSPPTPRCRARTGDSLDTYEKVLVRPGDTLSQLLWRRGLCPLYGRNGWVARMARENRGVDPDTGWVKAGTTLSLPLVDLGDTGRAAAAEAPEPIKTDEPLPVAMAAARLPAPAARLPAPAARLPAPAARLPAPAARLPVASFPVSKEPSPRVLDFKEASPLKREPQTDEVPALPAPYTLGSGGARLVVFPYSSTLASEGRAGGSGSAFLVSQTNIGLEAGLDVHSASGFGFSGTLGYAREKYVIPSDAEMRVVQENVMSWRALARTSRVWRSNLGLGLVGKDMLGVGSLRKGTATLLPLHVNGASGEMTFRPFASSLMSHSLTASVAYFPRQRVSLGLIQSGFEGRVGLDVTFMTRFAPLGLGLFYEETRLAREFAFDRRRAAGLRFGSVLNLF